MPNIRNILNITLNEIRKEMLITWSYRIQWFFEFTGLIMFFFFLSRINYFLNSSLDISFLTFSIWFYAILIIGDVGGKIAGEMRTGTFE
jgi:hypothetical protein